MLAVETQGKKELVETEYQKKKEQTQALVQAETEVKQAELNRQKQQIEVEAARLESQKIKMLADAEAYKKTGSSPNGSLEAKLATYKAVQKAWAEAFSKYQGNVTPIIQSRGQSTSNGATQFIYIMS
jgi:hypothetical protein